MAPCRNRPKTDKKVVSDFRIKTSDFGCVEGLLINTKESGLYVCINNREPPGIVRPYAVGPNNFPEYFQMNFPGKHFE